MSQTTSKTRVLAFLQNQWFKDPESARRIYASHNGDRERSARFRARALFAGCLTGRRIREAFDEDLRRVMVFEEASPEIGGKSSAAFSADAKHIAEAVEYWRPEIVIGFGRISGNGVLGAMARMHELMQPERIEFYFISAPHPAARHATVMEELRACAADVRRRLGMELVAGGVK